MKCNRLKRRDFIAIAGGAGAASQAIPISARAQQPERMRRIGLLLGGTADDTNGQTQIAAFVQRFQQLGWIDGHNVRIDYRWTAGNDEIRRKYAADLVALAPDVIVAAGSSLASALQATRTIPIVFPFSADPVGSGHVDNLARPGGNATGFALFEFGLSAKWLELLREIAPSATRVAVLRDTSTPAGNGQFTAIQSLASSLGVDVSPIDLRDLSGFERDVSAFARSLKGSMIVTASGFAYVHREPIVALAVRHELPTIYFESLFVVAGGLISYGADLKDQWRRAAGYVSRILKGATPADLPVQTPTKYELVINLKTAKTMGLDVPHSVLARADEVIE